MAYRIGDLMLKCCAAVVVACFAAGLLFMPVLAVGVMFGMDWVHYQDPSLAGVFAGAFMLWMWLLIGGMLLVTIGEGE